MRCRQGLAVLRPGARIVAAEEKNRPVAIGAVGQTLPRRAWVDGSASRFVLL